MRQLSIFDFIEETQEPKPKKPKPEKQKVKPETRPLSDFAFLYTATAKGHNSDIHFMMSLEDAQAWCSSELSHGVMTGAPWAYFFTSVENFCNCHWGQLKGVELDLRKLRDNGKWDEKISSLGLTKYGKHDIKRILSDYGIKVLV